MVKAAPGAFLFFFVLAWLLAFAVNRWGFSGQLQGTIEQLKAKDERLRFKDEQIQELKARLKVYSDEAEAKAEFMAQRSRERNR